MERFLFALVIVNTHLTLFELIQARGRRRPQGINSVITGLFSKRRQLEHQPYKT